MGVGPAYRHGDQVPMGICENEGGAGSVVRQEVGWMEIFGGQAPVDRLCGTAEVPPSGVGFCAARHLRQRDGVSDYGGRAARRVTPGPL